METMCPKNWPLRTGTALRQHGPALLVLFAWALGCALFSWSVGLEQRWTSDTTDTFYRIISETLAKPDHPQVTSYWATLWSGFTQVVKETPVTLWYRGLFDAYLRSFHLVWGDISLAYKVLVFPFTLLFGVVAYFFFLSLTGSRWVALALALAALMPLPLSWAGERAGLGPIWTYTRRYFLTACLPLITWLFFLGMKKKNGWLLLAIAAAGLGSNLHASGVILLEILLLAWLASGVVTPKRALQAGGLMVWGLLFSVAGISSLWERGLQAVSEMLLTDISGTAMAAPATTFQVLAETKVKAAAELQYLFYPPKIYEELPGWLMDSWLLLTISLSLIPLLLRIINKRENFSALFMGTAACLLFISFEQMWPWVLLASLLFLIGRQKPQAEALPLTSYLILATFWTSVLGMLFFQLGYGLIDGFPFIFDQLRGIRFMGFWVFIWIAVLSVPAHHAWTQTSPRLRRGFYAALVIALLLQGQTVYRQYRTQDHEQIEEKRALLEIAAWARSHTPPDSIFLVGYASFGTVAERYVAFSDKSSRNEGINWLPPKGLRSPKDTLLQAQGLRVTHMLIAPGDITPGLQPCVIYRNARFALAGVSCTAAALGLHREF